MYIQNSDMCLCPRVIYHRSNHYSPERMPLMMSVPCGVCDECARTARNDWFVRCWAEHHASWCQQTYFYTLTYNNEHLPKRFGMPCFCKRDVQLFCKRLKKVLSPNVRLKYFVSSEFGEKYGRPHYHALFFIDKLYNPFLFYKVVERCWQNGFVKYGDNAGVVRGLQGIQYVTKYVTKDFMYTDKFGDRFKKAAFNYVYAVFRRFVSLYRCDVNLVPYFDGELRFKKVCAEFDDEKRSFRVQTSYHLSEADEDLCARFLAMYRRFKAQHLPFHCQSTYLGADYALSNFGVDDVPVVMPNCSCVHFRLPRYYRRMFWYDRVENETDGKLNRFVLSEEGFKHYCEHLPKDFSLYKEVCQSFILSNHRYSDADLVDVNAELTSGCFESARDLKFFLSHFDLDLDVLAVYHAVFRGRVCTRVFEDVPLTESVVLEHWLDYVKVCFYDTSEYDYGRIYESDVRQRFRSMLWNFHPFFQPYEFACQLFDGLKVVDGRRVAVLNRKRETDVRKLKEKYSVPF